MMKTRRKFFDSGIAITTPTRTHIVVKDVFLLTHFTSNLKRFSRKNSQVKNKSFLGFFGTGECFINDVDLLSEAWHSNLMVLVIASFLGFKTSR